MLHWKHDHISLKADAYRGSSYILPIEPKLVARAIHTIAFAVTSARSKLWHNSYGQMLA
jgi:hypothetical protein